VRHPPAAAAKRCGTVLAGSQDDGHQGLRVGYVLVAVEEIGAGVRHADPEHLVDDVAGHDDDRERRETMAANGAHDPHPGEAVETGSVVPGVDQSHVDAVPQPGLVEGLGVTEGRRHLDAGILREDLSPAGADPYVVVDDRHPYRHPTTMNHEAGPGQGPEWHPWDPVVASRAVLTAAQGLGSRFHQVLSPRGAARTPAWRAAALMSAGVDVAKAAWLARDDRFRLAPRLALDVADLALWCLAADDDADSSEDAVIPGSSLAVEAGARWGPVGLVVPAANAAVAAAVRARRGHRLRLEQFSWQVMGTVGGWGLRALAGRRRSRLERRHQADLTARAHTAELAGLHDLIVEREGAIDVLQRATALVELSVPGAGRGSLAGAVKAAAAEAARDRVTYLADALARWQSRHNLTPDLARMVSLETAPGAGTVLLGASQARRLAEELDRLDLAGPVPVHVVAARSDQPFASRSLMVGPHVVDLPAEAGQTRWVLDATPMAFLMDLGWLAQPMGAQREAVPLSATAGPLLGALAGAISASRRSERDERMSPETAVGLAGAVTLGYTVAATRAMRHPHTPAGISRFPWVMALQGYELIRGISASESSTRARSLGLLGTAAVVAAGWRLSPRPRSARALLAELGWVVSFDVYTRRLRRAHETAGAELSARAADRDEAICAAAYRRGRARAHAIVAEALQAACDELDAAWPSLEPEVRDEARRRLGQAAAMLGG
jgi:hypothetical protein